MNVLAFDPDTKTTGYAVLARGMLVRAGLIRPPLPTRGVDIVTRIMSMVEMIGQHMSELRFKDPDLNGPLDAICIEGQRIYPNSKARPMDILHLAQVAGGILGVCTHLWSSTPTLMPEPADWKGTGGKAAFTKHIMRQDRIEYAKGGGLTWTNQSGLLVPGTQGLSRKDASHVIDAIGLARWVEADLELRRRTEERRECRALRDSQ